MREFSQFPHTKISHAYIADGQDVDFLSMFAVCSCDGQAPCTTCKDCIKAAKHIHPDIINIVRVKDEHGKLRKDIIVDQIRELKGDIFVAPNEAPRKVYIINEAELMNINSQNALLQMLEEPPAFVVFILKTPHPHALLPTVRSRCVYVRPPTEPAQSAVADDADEDVAAALARDYVAALDDNLALVRCMFSIEKLDKADFLEFVTFTREELSKVLRANPRNEKALKVNKLLTSALEMLSLNVSIGHISGLLCSPFAEEH